MINRAPRGKALGQIAPLAGGLAEVEDPVEQFPIAVLSGPPGLARLGKTIVDEVPFGVRQIRSVSHPQGTAGICLHCTYKNADFIGTILSFQTGSQFSHSARTVILVASLLGAAVFNTVTPREDKRGYPVKAGSSALAPGFKNFLMDQFSKPGYPVSPGFQMTASTTLSGHVPIDVARSEAPLFDDPVLHGASDPFVIWNPVAKAWFMYYTQRRATMPNPNGVDWVHGSVIAIAASEDGFTWKYLGTCQGDHDLSEPLKATGKGPEPGLTWWAPCFVYENKTFHMWVVLVDGVYRSWIGNRNIVHFTSDDGITWKYAGTCKLSSDRVIDPTVYKVKDLWYMVYKDEADGSDRK